MKQHYKRNKLELFGDKRSEEISLINTKLLTELDIPNTCLNYKSNIFLKAYYFNKSNSTLLLTHGLISTHHFEIGIIIPEKWKIKRFLHEDYYLAETFPVDLLRVIITKIVRKNTTFNIKHKQTFLKSESYLNKLRWQENLFGFIGVGVNDINSLTSAIACPKENDIFILAPILDGEYMKSNVYDGISHKLNSGNIDALSILYNNKIELFWQLNNGIKDHNYEQVKEALEQGENPNQYHLWEHIQFGYTHAETMLEKALSNEKGLEIIKLLISYGAEVPKNALAHLVNWGNMEIYQLLLEKGADIHEKSVTMTALERAKAFNNEDCIKMLVSLGAKE
jgi:hypothetical protein